MRATLILSLVALVGCGAQLPPDDTLPDSGIVEPTMEDGGTPPLTPDSGVPGPVADAGADGGMPVETPDAGNKDQAPFTSKTLAVFENAAGGAEVLGRSDEFSQAHSTFDRSVRMRLSRVLTEQEFLIFAAKAGRDWTAAERRSLTAVLQRLRPKLEGLKAPLPPIVQFVKTDGSEEGNAPYTRQNAIILPTSSLGDVGGLDSLIAHELFHIISRGNPQLRDELYAIIKYQKSGPLDLSNAGDLSSRSITNPDAPRHDHFISLTAKGKPILALQFLSGPAPLWKSGSLFSNMSRNFLEVVQQGNALVPRLNGTAPVLYDVSDVEGFFEQVGNNTQYIDDPEEILADNFMQLVMGTSPKTPRIHTEMKAVLSR